MPVRPTFLARLRPGRRARGVVAAVGVTLAAWGVVDAAGGGAWAPAGAAGVAGAPLSGTVRAGRAWPAPAVDLERARPVQVVRMVPRGFQPDPRMTPEAVRGAVEGASAYWAQQTGGEVSFRLASVSDWVSASVGCDDVRGLWKQAHEHVSDTGGRAHLLVVAPGAAGVEGGGCDFGYGSLGRADVGGSTYVTALNPELLSHELGHNLGLGHAGALECTGAQDGVWDGGAWTNGCRVLDYDDLFDVMGYSGVGFGGGYLGGVGLDRSGMDAGAVRRVTGSTDAVRLLPMSQVGAGVRVLAVEVPGEPVYYAEYRTGAGRDASVVGNRWHPSAGLRILRRDPRHAGDGSLELDATPGGRRYDRALPVGSTFTSASGDVRITLVDADASGATLRVQVVHG